MNRKLVTLTLGLALTMVMAGRAQTTTGTVSGRILDSSKKPISGVSLALTSPSFMADLTFLTEAGGEFWFPALPAGVYELRADLPGFKSKITKNIIVDVGRTTRLIVELEASTVEEETTVIARSPSIDVRSPKLSVTVPAVFFTAVPMARDLYDIQNLIPGAVSEGSGENRTSSILGGTVRGQRYLIDGGPVNDPASGVLLANLNTEIIENVEIEMGALPAEAGALDGVIVNVISKRGSRTFGSATFYYTSKGLSKDLFTADDLKAYGVNPPEKPNESKDYSFSLGGPLMPDRVWIFLDFRRLTWTKTSPYAPESRMAQLGFTTSPHYDYDHRESLGFVQLTIRPTDQITYSGMLHFSSVYEPVDRSVFGPSASYEAGLSRDTENSFITTHEATISIDQNTIADVRAAYVSRKVPLIAITQGQPSTYDLATDVWWGAAPYNEVTKVNRLSGVVSLTRFQQRLLGFDHEFKLGVEFDQSEYHRDWYRSDPFVMYWADYAAGNSYYFGNYQGRFQIYPCPSESGQWDNMSGLRRFSGFVQDHLSAGPLTLNLGVRFDYNLAYLPSQGRPILRYSVNPAFINPEITDSNAVLNVLIDQMHASNTYTPFDVVYSDYRTPAEFVTFSPRLGAVLDLFGDGRTALQLSYSRYYEPLWVEKYNLGQIFASHPVDVCWNDLNRNGLMDLPPDDAYTILDPGLAQDVSYLPYGDLKSPSTDEIITGLEHEIAADFKLGLNVIWRTSKNLIEMVDSANGYNPAARDAIGPIWLPFSFTDPGADGTFGTADDQKLTVYGLRADRPDPVWKMVNVPEAQRKYWAVMFTFDKRWSHRWQLKGSVVYSSFKGNVSAGDLNSTDLSATFDTPNALTNAYGPLYFDRPWQVKIAGTYLLPWDISLGAYYQYASGIPWQRTLARVYFPANYLGFGVKSPGYSTVNAEPAGSERGPAFSNLNIRLEKSFPLGSSARVALYLDIFNVTGQTGKNIYRDSAGWLYDNLYPDKTQAAYVVNPNYGKVASVFGVRSFLIGARYSF